MTTADKEAACCDFYPKAVLFSPFDRLRTNGPCLELVRELPRPAERESRLCPRALQRDRQSLSGGRSRAEHWNEKRKPEKVPGPF